MTRKRAMAKPFDRLHPAKAARIVELNASRISQRLIALEVGVSQATVSRVLMQHAAALAAPLSARSQSIELIEPAKRHWPDDGADHIARYREEKAKAKARLAAARKVALAEAKADYKAQQKREKELRKGGRPRKNAGHGAYPLHIAPSSWKPAKPGKPQLVVRRDDVPDLAASLSPFYGSAPLRVTRTA